MSKKNTKTQQKVLIVGGGGREHAIAVALSKSPRISELYAAPGNGGTASLAVNVPLKATDLEGIVEFCQDQAIDFVVVAPDDPLALGLVDRLNDAGIASFGPVQEAARLEASKSFAKQLMREAGIPTAAYEVFDDYAQAEAYIQSANLPLVLKADGLALGKGVIICETRKQATDACRGMMLDRQFGDAGKKLVIEEFLRGPELTILCFCDGKTLVPMPSSRDHKRALDGDQGLNTGGMGAVSPGADLSPADWQLLRETIFEPTLAALRARGIQYKGVIYFGLMLTEEGPKVIEYNARFGDPETQTILPLLKTDLFEIMLAVYDGTLARLSIEWEDMAACCVVLASGGYPGEYQVGYPVTGLDQVDGVAVYHAGTRRDADNEVLTSGGRVLAVTAKASCLKTAIVQAYREIDKIDFKNKHLRRDIGRKA